MTGSPAGWFVRAASWVLPTLLLAGLTVAVVRIGSPAASEGFLEEPTPIAPGTTWVYRTTSEGQPPGLLRTQAVRDTLYVLGAEAVPATTLEVTTDGRGVLGSLHELTYQAVMGNEEVVLGYRTAPTGTGSLTRFDPPQTALRYPLRPGTSWTWRGMDGDQERRTRTEVLEVGPLDVLGDTRNGCVLLREEDAPIDQDAGSPVISERWRCPSLGTVRERIEVPAADLRLDIELIEFHAPGVDLGGGEASAPSDPAPGGTIGMGPGRASHVPDARLDLDAPRWNDSRAGVVQFPAIGGAERSLVTEEDGSVSMMDTRTGRILWRVWLKGPIVAPPVLAGSLALVADSQKALFALDAETGAIRWSVVFDDLVSSSPLVHGGTVVVATEDMGVHALRLADGEPVWRSETGALVKAPPALAGDHVVIADEEGAVGALRLADGEPAWDTSTQGALSSPPAVAGGRVFLSDDEDALYAFDAASGDLLWKRFIGRFGILNLPLAATPEALAVAWSTTTEESFATVFDARDGSVRWERPLRTAPETGPAVLGEDLVVLSGDGELLAFGMRDGALGGRTRLPAVLENPSERDAGFALAYVDGALVATMRETSTDIRLPWAQTSAFAFAAGGPEDAGPGVHFTTRLRPVPETWTVPPVFSGPDLVYPGLQPILWAVPPDGDPRPLLETGEVSSPFVARADRLLLAQAGEALVAIDPASGRERWRFEIGPPQNGFAPAAMDGAVAVPLPGAGLAMLDGAGGRARWVAPAAGAGRSVPLGLDGGDVAYGVGGLTRFDGATGSPEWTVSGIETFGPLAEHRGVIVMSAVPTGTGEAFLLAVDAATGEERWRHPLNPTPFIGPGAGAGVAVGADATGGVAALDLASGEPRWSTAMRSPPCGSPLITPEGVVLFEGGRAEDLNDRDYRVVVLDPETGRFRGSIEPPDRSGSGADCDADDGRLVLPAALMAQVTRVVAP